MRQQLGNEERMVWAYDRVCPLHFTIAANIIGTLHLEGLQQALVKVQQRHPLLNVKIALDRSEIPWVITDTGNIPVRLVERHSPQQWQQEVERELANPFDWNQAPLIRLVLVRGNEASDLIISCHHSISDGMSAVFLLRDILQMLGTPDRSLPALPSHPPYAQLIPHFEQKPPTLPFEPSLATIPTQSTVPAHSRPHLHAWSLTTAETIEIVHACKQAKTTVHTAICAAFLLTISQQPEVDAATPLKCLTAINFRRFLPAIEDDFGFYYGLIKTVHSIDPAVSVWELAHALKAELDRRTAPDQIFAHLPEIEGFLATPPSFDDVVKMVEIVNGCDLCVTNLGRLTIPQQYGELQLVALYGPSIISHTDRDLFVGVMTLGEQMFFSLTYSESDFSATQIKQIQQTAMQFLQSVIQ
jgi:Condensation domain